MIKATEITAAINSAATMENQMPSIPQISGKINTAADCNTSVLRKEIKAEMGPLLRAVKKDEPKMAKPVNRNENEQM